jgi:hypothetical protein
MVAIVEISLVIVCAVLGVWWFGRTSLYRAHRRSGADPGQFGTHTPGSFGVLGSKAGAQSRHPPHVVSSRTSRRRTPRE